MKKRKIDSHIVQYYPPAHANTKGRSKRIKFSKERKKKKHNYVAGVTGEECHMIGTIVLFY